MKKLTKILTMLILASLLAAFPFLGAYAEGEEMTVTLRVEGVNECFCDKAYTIPYTDTLTLQQALLYIDANEDSLTITGLETAYITDINGDTAGEFGGWDGWLYTVNNTEATGSISTISLSDGDSVLLYFGDPYGVGMQYPVADTSAISDGVIRFTSHDTTFDADWNPVVNENPVKEMAVTWECGGKTTEYMTDADGKITIDASLLTNGSHAVSVRKTAANGLPLVLRMKSDYTVTLSIPAPETNINNPNTGENTASFALLFITAGVAFVAVMKKKSASTR